MVAREGYRQSAGKVILHLLIPLVFIESLLCPSHCAPCHCTRGTFILLGDIGDKPRKITGTGWHREGSVRIGVGAALDRPGGELHVTLCL